MEVRKRIVALGILLYDALITGPPVVVSVTIYVSTISAISEVEMVSNMREW